MSQQHDLDRHEAICRRTRGMDRGALRRLIAEQDCAYRALAARYRRMVSSVSCLARERVETLRSLLEGESPLVFMPGDQEYESVLLLIDEYDRRGAMIQRLANEVGEARTEGADAAQRPDV